MVKSKILKSFTINGLFGTMDLTIPFENQVKILIGENGLGKTQVLNMFYYTLTKRFDKLVEYTFNTIILEFENTKVKIHKKDLELRLVFGHPLVENVIKRIGKNKFLEFRRIFMNSDLENPAHLRKNYAIRKFLEKQDLPISPGVLIEAVEISFRRRSADLFSTFSEDEQSTIDEYLKDYQILYFPTYRRVEEDLRNLGYDEEKISINREDTRLIHFGMDDVDKRFNEITQQIDRLSRDGLSKISSDILSQLVRGLPRIDKNFLRTINQQDIDIILARVGNQISEDDKLRIKNIVTAKEIQDKDHSLLYFLQKLINIYDQQRELDESIKGFRDVCNKYLVNKKIIYDESSLEIYVQSEIGPKKLLLSKLSSGEKQIISIFSKIYLASSDNKFIVLFDEPELSLSIFWQKELLPDIFNSGKCDFLLAVTHSPFIFENDLDKYAIGLNEYIKLNKKAAL